MDSSSATTSTATEVEGATTLDRDKCRFVLIVLRNRVVVKARGDAPVPHLQARTSLSPTRVPAGAAASSFSSFSSGTATTTGAWASASPFSQTVVDFYSEPGKHAKSSVLRVASGMDLVLAFAAVALGDRFFRFDGLAPDEATRKLVLDERFEMGDHATFVPTAGGDEAPSVFAVKQRKHGTTTAARSLLY